MGHILGLRHVFNETTFYNNQVNHVGYGNALYQNPPEESFCLSAGDFVCDTEKAPLILQSEIDEVGYWSPLLAEDGTRIKKYLPKYNNTFNFHLPFNSILEASYEVFHPQLNNIMGYYSKSMNVFTAGQESRMYTALNHVNELRKLFVSPADLFGFEIYDSGPCTGEALELSYTQNLEDLQFEWYANDVLFSTESSVTYASNESTSFKVEITNNECNWSHQFTYKNSVDEFELLDPEEHNLCSGNSIILAPSPILGLQYTFWDENNELLYEGAPFSYTPTDDIPISLILNGTICGENVLTAQDININLIDLGYNSAAFNMPSDLEIDCPSTLISLGPANETEGCLYQFFVEGELVSELTPYQFTTNQSMSCVLSVTSSCGSTSFTTDVNYEYNYGDGLGHDLFLCSITDQLYEFSTNIEGALYNWNTISTGAILSQENQISVYLNGAQTISVEVLVPECDLPVLSDQLEVFVLDEVSFSLELTSDPLNCPNEVIEIETLPIPNSTYLWESTNELFVSPGLNSYKAYLIPVEGETINLTFRNEECNMEFSEQVTFNYSEPTLEIDLESFEQICLGESVTVGPDEVEGYTYTWQITDLSNNTISTAMGSPIEFTPTTNTQFNLQIDGANCPAVNQYVVVCEVLDQALDIDLEADQNICLGETVLGPEEVEGYTYTWQVTDLSNNTISTATGSPIVFTATTNTQLNLLVDGPNCPAVNESDILVEIIDETLDLDLGEDQSICLGETVTVGPEEVEGYTYTWQITDLSDNTTSTAMGSPIEFTPTANTQFNLQVNGPNCQAVNELHVVYEVLDLTIQVNLIQDQTICIGDTTVVGLVGFGGNNYNLAWTGSSTGDEILSTQPYFTVNPTEETTYTLNISTNLCEFLATGNNNTTVSVEEINCNCSAYYHHQNLTISSNQTWHIDNLPPALQTQAPAGVLRIENSLIITAGNTLTLSPGVSLEMGPYALITVEQGAQLILNGATLSKACDTYWKGIQVFGNSNLNQSGSNQGKVVLKAGARLEYAKTGVSLIGHNLSHETIWGTAGGILQTNNATFYNCLRAVEFMQYKTLTMPAILQQIAALLKTHNLK